jgi:hypothetical protein
MPEAPKRVHIQARPTNRVSPRDAESTYRPTRSVLGLSTVSASMLLARRFTLNPVLVIISRFWMWGIPGAILSVPMLAITKIICDRVRPLAAFGHFLEG